MIEFDDYRMLIPTTSEQEKKLLPLFELFNNHKYNVEIIYEKCKWAEERRYIPKPMPPAERKKMCDELYKAWMENKKNKNMNIVEAIQCAENGKLITNGILWRIGHYLEYWKEGIFREHKIIADDKTEFVQTITSFSMGHILSNNWTIVHSLKLK